MMKTNSRLWKGLLAISVSGLFSASVMASIVYDNTTTFLQKIHSPGNREFGDEIFLGGTARQMTEFQFQYFATNTAGALTGSERAEVFFRLNDGPPTSLNAPTPGTIVYVSGPFSLAQGFRTVNITGLNLLIPDHFTWSVAFSGLSSTERAGLLLYDPPTAGSSFKDFWELTDTGWQTLVVDGGATPGNFAARITAVPEPGTLALGLLGGLGCLFLRFRRR